LLLPTATLKAPVIGNCFRERQKQGRFCRSPTATVLR
jgi:hypothetical protein